jgi:hypothetical protein
MYVRYPFTHSDSVDRSRTRIAAYTGIQDIS